MSTRRPAFKVGDRVVHFFLPELQSGGRNVKVNGPYTIVKKDYMYSDRWVIRTDGPKILESTVSEKELYHYDEDLFAKYSHTISAHTAPSYTIPRSDLSKLDLHAAMRTKHRNQELRRIWEEKTDMTSDLGVGPLNRIKEYTGNLGVKPTNGPTPYMLNMMKRFEARQPKTRKQRKSRRSRKSRKHA